MFRFRAVKEIDRYETWADFVRTKRKGWIPTKHSVLCSAHFEEKWLSFRHLFEQDHMPRKRKYCKLHEDAFPTIHAKSPDPPAAEKGMSEKGQDCLLHAAPSKQLVAKSARPGQEKLQRGKEKSDHRGTVQTKIRRSNTRKKSDRVPKRDADVCKKPKLKDAFVQTDISWKKMNVYTACMEEPTSSSNRHEERHVTPKVQEEAEEHPSSPVLKEESEEYPSSLRVREEPPSLPILQEEPLLLLIVKREPEESPPLPILQEEPPSLPILQEEPLSLQIVTKVPEEPTSLPIVKLEPEEPPSFSILQEEPLPLQKGKEEPEEPSSSPVVKGTPDEYPSSQKVKEEPPSSSLEKVEHEEPPFSPEVKEEPEEHPSHVVKLEPGEPPFSQKEVHLLLIAKEETEEPLSSPTSPHEPFSLPMVKEEPA